jgi:hypothetical protein
MIRLKVRLYAADVEGICEVDDVPAGAAWDEAGWDEHAQLFEVAVDTDEEDEEGDELLAQVSYSIFVTQYKPDTTCPFGNLTATFNKIPTMPACLPLPVFFVTADGCHRGSTRFCKEQVVLPCRGCCCSKGSGQGSHGGYS